MELALGNTFEWLRSSNSCLASEPRIWNMCRVPLNKPSPDYCTLARNGGTDIELGYTFQL